MTFLAPWAIAAGVLGAAALVALHLVSRQRPAAYVLPTARFIPDRQTLVSRAARRPHDLWLLLVRVLLVLFAAIGLAQPVLAPRRVPVARLLLIEREALRAHGARIRALAGERGFTRVVVFDTVSTMVPSLPALDSLLSRASTAGMAGRAEADRSPAMPRAATRRRPIASLSAALAAARRTGAELGEGADSVELVLLAEVSDASVDAATSLIRAEWPGRVRIERVAGDTARAEIASALESRVDPADVLGPAAAGMRVTPGATAVRIRRTALDARDSAFARGGGAVVRWDTGAVRYHPEGVSLADDVVVAALGRAEVAGRGRVIARWADGSVAAVEEEVGGGCIRTVGVRVPPIGDLPLQPGFIRVARGFLSPCFPAAPSRAASADVARQLAGRGTLAPGSTLASDEHRPSWLRPWLLAAALACAVLELALRRWGAQPTAAPA